MSEENDLVTVPTPSKMPELRPLPRSRVWIMNSAGAYHDVSRHELRKILAKYPNTQVVDSRAVPQEIRSLCDTFTKEELFTFVTVELEVENLPRNANKENLAAIIIDNDAFDELMSRKV